MMPVNSISLQTGQAVPSAELGTGSAQTGIGKRLEQLLWTEMLSHTGLEKAMSVGGAEGASEFFRFMIEAMAKDFAEQHPLGLDEKVQSMSPETRS